MKTANIVLIPLLALLVAPYPAAAQGALSFSSAPRQQPAELPAADKDFGAVIEDIVETTPAQISIQDNDVLKWEQDAHGRYIYLELTQEKKAELSQTVASNIGKPLRIFIRDNFILIPETEAMLDQQQGLAIPTANGGASELAFSMLDFSKKSPAVTMIEAGPIPPEHIEPAAAPDRMPKKLLKQESDEPSGPVYSSAQDTLKPAE